MYSVYWHGWTFVGYPEATVLGALEATPPPRAWRHGTGRWAWR